jgi:glycosyltransferase involved in cell wall biosynthesis
MRAAIYNKFWHSMGGGERHSGMIAQILSQSGVEVDLIGHTKVSLDELGDRLALDLSKTTLRVTPDRGEDAIAELSADYDLLVNATYMSRLVSQAAHSVYLCFFPTPFDHDLGAAHRAAVRVIGPRVRPHEGQQGIRYGTGWYPPEGGRLRHWAWSSGDGVIRLERGPEVALAAEFGRPGGFEPATMVVELDGDELARVPVSAAAFTRQTIRVPESAEPREIHFRSPTFSPGEGDPRELGIAMSRLNLAGSRRTIGNRAATRYPWLLRDAGDLGFLDSYDVVLANSAYTQGWITRLWSRHSEILFPPIEISGITPHAERQRTILTVGRFFAPGYGHSKRQLEIVNMFGQLARSELLDGWKLVVLGGCEPSQRPYLDQVTAAAAGLPVEIHANAPRSLVESHMSSASIFWSATGLGENTEKRPWTNEHFGMTTAEAMAGGCVPVVIDRAGQREIVREGVDGFRWSNDEQWRIRTVQVGTNEQLRARLAASATERVRQFSDDAFAMRWHELALAYNLMGT